MNKKIIGVMAVLVLVSLNLNAMTNKEFGGYPLSDGPKHDLANFDEMVNGKYEDSGEYLFGQYLRGLGRPRVSVHSFPGYPTDLNASIEYVTNFENAGKQVERLYSKMFPGYVGRSVEIKLVSAGSMNGALGVTKSWTKEQSNYIPIGDGQSEVGAVQIEVYDGSIDTAVHETAHSIDVSIRGKTSCFKFFEEGQAVFVNWIFFPKRRDQDAACLKHYAKMSPEELRSFILRDGGFSEAPPGHDYPLAGFFVCQVYDLAGPSTAKFLIQSSRSSIHPGNAYKEILLGLANGPKGSVSEEQFWNILHERLLEWSK